MSLKNLPELSSPSKNQKMSDLFSSDIDTKPKINFIKKSSLDSFKIVDHLSSPKTYKEFSVENDNDFYSPYVKRTISNVIKNTSNSKFPHYNDNY